MILFIKEREGFFVEPLGSRQESLPAFVEISESSAVGVGGWVSKMKRSGAIFGKTKQGFR